MHLNAGSLSWMPAVRVDSLADGSAEQNTALDSAELVGGKLIAKYVQDAHSVVRIYDSEGKPLGEVALPGLGDVSGFSGEVTTSRLSIHTRTISLRPRSTDTTSGPTHRPHGASQDRRDH